MSDVQVTNRNPFPLPGRYDGQDYLFPPNKPTAIPRDAATHIFGLGQSDKTRALAQLGLWKAGVSFKDALAMLDKVSFSEGRMVYEAQHEPGKHDPSKHQPGQQQAGQHQPGQQQPGEKPEQPKPGPGRGEDEEESEESGDSPGAPRSPGRKSEAGELQAISPASDDLKRSAKRHW